MLNIQEFKSPKRIIRGLLDFVGETSRYLFGTVRQLKKVYGHMAEIYDFAKRACLSNADVKARLQTIGQHLDSKIDTISKQVHQTALFMSEYQNFIAKEEDKLDVLNKAYRWFIPNLFV